MATIPLRLIRVPTNGTATTSYTLAPTESLSIESVFCVANTVPASGGGSFMVTYTHQSGLLIGTSRCADFAASDANVEVTWAPYLEDSAYLGSITGGTELQSGLIQTILTPGCRVTVSNDDAAVVLTMVNLYVTNEAAVDSVDAGDFDSRDFRLVAGPAA